ncbi:hypothetical protein [uncultured Novosphingobium sp.]|uniref:hypothetical protein n=1 Tax=uncultured Novosphingobium sp. TaxID=292277 RepID=UPI002587F447|nr:hypothetical protein [uncultured Novosphingobium sp.]
MSLDDNEMGKVGEVIFSARVLQQLIATLTEKIADYVVNRGIKGTRERDRVCDIEHFGSPESKSPRR